MALERSSKALRPLCYTHNVEMKLIQLKEIVHSLATYSLVYLCPRSGCQIGYAGKTGYFAHGVEGHSRQTGALRVSCPLDGQPMFLAAVHRENTAVRLWRCAKPNCPGEDTIEEFVFDAKDPFIQQLLRAN